MKEYRRTAVFPLAVAILFGPADGPVTAKAVLDAAKEANVKGYRHLYVIGFAITAEARAEIDAGEDVLGLPATFVAATMDLQMGDLLKNQRSSQIFSVCGAPDVEVMRLDEAADDGTPRWQVKLRGLDVFDPTTMQSHHAAGDDVPCWMLDTAYNGMVFHADQVFFPKTSAWDSLRKALRATHDEAVWQHLAGDTSAPFVAAVGTDIAVKVIDERGNELPVIRRLGVKRCDMSNVRDHPQHASRKTTSRRGTLAERRHSKRSRPHHQKQRCAIHRVLSLRHLLPSSALQSLPFAAPTGTLQPTACANASSRACMSGSLQASGGFEVPTPILNSPFVEPERALGPARRRTAGAANRPSSCRLLVPRSALRRTRRGRQPRHLA